MFNGGEVFKPFDNLTTRWIKLLNWANFYGSYVSMMIAKRNSQHEVQQLHSTSGSSGGLQSTTRVPSMPGGLVLLRFAHTSVGIALIKSFSLKNAMPGCVHRYKMFGFWFGENKGKKRFRQYFESRTHGVTSVRQLRWE